MCMYILVPATAKLFSKAKKVKEALFFKAKLLLNSASNSYCSN